MKSGPSNKGIDMKRRCFDKGSNYMLAMFGFVPFSRPLYLFVHLLSKADIILGKTLLARMVVFAKVPFI